MPELPETAVPYFETEELTERTVPSTLLREHATKPGVWARIRVLRGQLRYRTLDGPDRAERLAPGREGVVAPTVRHRLEIDAPVRFRLELLRDEGVLPPLPSRRAG